MLVKPIWSASLVTTHIHVFLAVPGPVTIGMTVLSTSGDHGTGNNGEGQTQKFLHHFILLTFFLGCYEQSINGHAKKARQSSRIQTRSFP